MKPLPPLAERARPDRLDAVIGQQHLLGEQGPLRLMLAQGRVPSLVFWGPPGVGKTTLARLIAQHVDAQFLQLSAVLAGVKEIREAVASAQAAAQGLLARGTVLFIDEIHRFSKSQQDALLPYVEDGTVTLIGATTENPSFELNGALLSRVRVLVLQPLTQGDLLALLQRSLVDAEHGLAATADALPLAWLERIAEAADGDARKALVLLETAYALGQGPSQSPQLLERLIGQGLRRFDKQGEHFYDQISALHKSVRGSDPDAALYWLARMLDGGADGGYIARRLCRMASEDIGLADPRALNLCLDAWAAFERLGSPEGDLALAEAVVYLAVAAKSNRIYTAFKAAKAAVAAHGSLEVPLHLRNAPTALMQQLDYGRGYRYDPDEPSGHATGQQYLPERLRGTQFYLPSDKGLERAIGEKLLALKSGGGR